MKVKSETEVAQSSAYNWASLVAQMVVSACNAGDWVQLLGREDPLEKEMATHSSIPPWKIPWTKT